MIHPKNIALLTALGLLILFSACEETTDWELNPGTNGQLIVEAILTDELKQHEIRLSQSYPTLNGVAPAVTDAQVWVQVNQISFPFTPDALEPGLYKSETPFSVIDKLVYTLHIVWQGQEYTATSELAGVAPLPDITFQSFGKRDSLAFAEFAPVYNPDQQAMYEMNIDWSHLTEEEPAEARMYFYTFNTIDVSGLVRPIRDTVFFPRGSIVSAKKFGLNDDFADYLRSMVIETDWRGGIFYSAAASLPTNISNGAQGFFSTCAVDKDTIIAQ